MFSTNKQSLESHACEIDDRTKLRRSSAAQSSPPVAALVPAVLKSRFLLQEQIGSGGMGTVYRAKDLRKVEVLDSQPFLAIKVLNSEFRKHPGALTNLQREAVTTQSLSHENIVKVFDFDKEGDVPFVTMELLQGVVLADLLREHPQGLPGNLAWPLIRGFCSALRRAHAEGVVHADLKPDNLFVTHTGQLKIFDFGLARAAQSDLSRGVVPIRSDIESMPLDPYVGALTPAYASRAVLEGNLASTRDDLFAAALVIYQVLTGRHPYERVPANQTHLDNISLGRPRLLSSRQWRFLLRAMALDEDHRLSSVIDLEAGLFHKSPWPMRLIAFGLGSLVAIGVSSL